VVLADLTVWNIFWDMLWFFFLFMWILILFNILGDLFRDHETSGGVKALWCIFIVFLPFLAVFIYLIARGSGMAQRSAQRAQQAQSQFDDYVRSTAGTSAAEQIQNAKDLLDAGTITQADFDQLKAKALA
jgi:ABC-type multidrug transport system fused ATPase/permease subunit